MWRIKWLEILGKGGFVEVKVLEALENMRLIVRIIVENELGYFMIAYIGVVLLMVVDVLTGFTQAKINKKLASYKMSNGLLKKFNILVLITVLMFLSLLMPENVGYTVVGFVFVYEYVNELTSIGENLLKMNIEINFMQPVLKVLNKYLNNDDKGKDGEE